MPFHTQIKERPLFWKEVAVVHLSTSTRSSANGELSFLSGCLRRVAVVACLAVDRRRPATGLVRAPLDFLDLSMNSTVFLLAQVLDRRSCVAISSDAARQTLEIQKCLSAPHLLDMRRTSSAERPPGVSPRGACRGVPRLLVAKLALAGDGSAETGADGAGSGSGRHAPASSLGLRH